MKALLPFALATLSAQFLDAAIDFTRDVQPILNKHCIACHGGVKEAGDVSFIFRDQVLGKGESGETVVVPGKPDASEMIARVITEDPDDLMPQPDHGPRLGDDDVEILRRWISEGAVWGEHWSFTAPEKHEPPFVNDSDWVVNEIDRFILANLESENLSPTKQASPSEWLRRASLDLTGLPPTIKELDTFEIAAAADFPAAITQETERLLASPHFGERWASVWQDLARYADSEGLGMDHKRDVWKYRDWLIEAFNKDLPYDRFVIDQLAGDLVPESTMDQKIATVFHRLTQSNSEGGTDDEEFRLLAAMDRNTTTWEVFQGVSMSCVQCHSHPYDPIKHEEYYTSLSFFNNTADSDSNDDLPLLQVPKDVTRYEEANALVKRITDLEQSIYKDWIEVDESSTWIPVDNLDASSPTAEMSVVMKDGYAEFRATDNAKAGSVYTLEASIPDALASLSAFRLTYLPKNEKAALTDAEWGASLNHIQVEKISPEGKPQPLKPVDVIPDEAHPLYDPMGSLNRKGLGWGTHYKFFRPRHATFVLSETSPLLPGEKIRITLHNGGIYTSAYAMVPKRGRIALSSDSSWIEKQTDTQMVSSRRELGEAKNRLTKIPHVKTPVIAERDPEQSRVTNFFNRGNWLDKGHVIPASNTPGVFPSLKSETEQPTRLDFARWIASPENPLTARVVVNRFWLELFGVGIVPTPEDFGSAGEKPTHPQLLDTLAVRFSTEMDWSIKALLREFVTSATYRQSNITTPELAAMDADNRLLARGPRLRLTGEMVRDSALAASGLLNPDLYGAPVFPPLPPGVWKPFDNQKWITPEPGDPQRYRRAIYTFWKRSIPYPTFMTFDAPSREMCSKRRMPSNTPIQALAVMNDPAFHECSQALARRMKYETEGSLEQKISLGYRATTSRKITSERLAELTELYNELTAIYEADPSLKKGMAGTSDGAALTVIASVLLNLDEAITR